MRIITLPYTAQPETLYAIRAAVFVQEQQVPVEMELDDRDPLCLHVLALANDMGIGTGRIDLEQAGKIGRVAVLKAYRHQGVGRQLMSALEQVAQQQGLETVWLHAQVSALSFYQKLGYIAEGDGFIEANIPHQTMRKRV